MAALSHYVVALVVLLLFPLFKIFYNLFFHPLRNIPGPKSWAATRLSYIYSAVRGNLGRETWKLHEKYGDIVRVAPNEISFATPDAFDDILLVHQGRPPFPKNPIVYGGRPGQVVEDIGTAMTPAAHSRIRKAFDHAFTEKALLRQEPTVQKYIHFLIQRLKEEALLDKSKSCVVNLFDWYTFATFDILGALTFGESFNCLENKTLHPWIEEITGWIKALTFVTSARYFPLLEFALQKAIPKSILEAQHKHFEFVYDKIHRRLNHETLYEDFFTSILKSKEGQSLSIAELEETAHVIMLAGSDTTTTTLCGITVYLLSHPEIQEKLAAEIRGAFSSVEEITMTSTRKLKYLHGVIQEGLRLCSPTPYLISRLVPKGGEMVAGTWFPEGTIVVPHSRAVGLNYKLWNRPLDFVPERWLDGPDRPAEFESDVREATKPFSVGPRNCVGKYMALANLRLILAQLIWSFDLTPAGKPVDWFAQDNYFVIMKDPVMARLTPIRE